MTPREAVVAVLEDASEPLHWTVVQDRALRGGMLDPFEIHDVRGAVLGALRALTAEGVVHRHGKGVYSMTPPEAVVPDHGTPPEGDDG
jgi:hypothetical protein